VLCVGLIVNPVAGLGGTVALKGSDGVDAQRLALARGAIPRVSERVAAAFAPLQDRLRDLELVTWGGAMGADVLRPLGIPARVLGEPAVPSTSADTGAAARTMVQAGVDVLLFAGGDGTARDLAAAVPLGVPVIGIPSGVKMHSGVFTITPADAGRILVRLLDGGLVASDVAEVHDIDETALRDGGVATRYYGELSVPRLGGYLQHVKQAGREVEALVLAEIAESIAERAAAQRDAVVLGPGSTVAAVKRRLGVEPTLLGFDVWRADAPVIVDADAAALRGIAGVDTKWVLSFTRGQGFLIGRGNQQLTADVLRAIPRRNLWIAASRTKLSSLDGRPLRVDSGDPDVDRQWCGLIEIVSGYEDALWYRVGND
jgi:predicted polyphosphate/ATP-dependent NAD kinase